MVGDMTRVTLKFDLPKCLLCFSNQVNTYTHTKN